MTGVYLLENRKSHQCHFEQREKSAFLVRRDKADFSTDESGFEMTIREYRNEVGYETRTHKKTHCHNCGIAPLQPNYENTTQ